LAYLRDSVSFPGEHGFEIAFEQQNKDTKSITWTVRVCAINRLINYLFTLPFGDV